MFGRRYNLRSKKYIKEKRKKLLVESGINFAIVLLAVALLALIAHLEQFKIENIEISGNDVIQDHEILKAAHEEIDGKYFKIFPRYNSIIFPRNSIVSTISSRYRRIEDIDVSFKNFHTIKIEIREREPRGVWCGLSGSDISDTQKCYFLDDDGYIFSEAPLFSGDLFFKYYGGEVEGKVIGSNYLPKDKFKELTFLIQSIKNLKLYPTSYEWGIDGDSSIRVEAKDDAKVETVILFNNNDDLGRIFENLELVLEDETFISDEVVSLEYIDLRFGNKIFFK